MMSHAINEGIIKFVVERNGIERQKTKGEERSIEELINELREKNYISKDCAYASKRIWESHRNDIHHMNPKVAQIPFKDLAQRNIKHLSTIEQEIFGCHYSNGAIVCHQPKYWDKNPDGTVNTFLRLE